MQQKRQFSVLIEWGYFAQKKHSYENCFIAPTKPDDHQYNGDNYVGRCGNEGMSFDIYGSLEEALEKCEFNPKYIKFSKLTLEEKRFVRKFRRTHQW